MAVRQWLALLPLASTLACGEAAPPPATVAVGNAPSPLRTSDLPSAPVVPDAGAAPVASPPHRPQGPFLYYASNLKRFFDALAALEDGSPTDDARILQIGDSHTAADWYTGVVRRLLQTKFGDGGRGFVALGKPWKGYVQDNVRFGMTREWEPLHSHLQRGHLVGDGQYGLTGVAITTSRAGGSAWADETGAEHAEVLYVAQPSGGSFDLLVDGAQVARIQTRADPPHLGSRGVDIDSGPHRIEVRGSGSGNVRILGALLEAKAKGVVLDAYGRDGARAAGMLNWSADHLADVLKWRNPALVILSFGTNECGDKDVTTAMYERDLSEVLARVSRGTPNGSCMLLGPSDYVQYGAAGPQPHPRLAEVIASQKRVAEAAHCSFYDQTDAMGGLGSIANWANEDPPRARKDGIHLSRDGYTSLATTFVEEVSRAYAAYRKDAAPAPPAPKSPALSPGPVAGR